MIKKDLTIFVGGPKGYALKRLHEEADKLGLSLMEILYKDLSFFLSSNNIEIFNKNEILPKTKNVFLRGLGEEAIYNPIRHYLLSWYKERGSKVINSRSFSRWPSLDKTTQYLSLSKAGLPIIQSFVFGSREEALTAVDQIGYPFIVKDNVGGLGVDVFKIENKAKLKELLETKYNLKTIKKLLFQKFLEGGRDLRVIVIGGKVIGAMERIALPGKYLANYSQGGKVAFYDIESDTEAKNLALKVANLFLLDYCGVDLMRNGDGKWVVLEVNRACQFEGFEKATGINIARSVIDYFVSNRLF